MSDQTQVPVPARDEFDDRLRPFKRGSVGRQRRHRPAIAPVSHANADLVETAERIQMHQGDVGRAAEHGSMSAGYRVEPAASPGASGRGSIFVPGLADSIAEGIFQLADERPRADASGIGFGRADRTADVASGYARPRSDAVRARAIVEEMRAQRRS